ncbi:hypothetical protein ACQEU6_39895 [Spirillospora sp. CA-108201]
MSSLIGGLLVGIAVLVGTNAGTVVGFLAKLSGATTLEVVTRAGITFAGATTFVIGVMTAAKLL